MVTTAIVALALGALLLPSVVTAAESGFQVSSYIPKHFSDFLWYVQGSTGFNWSDVAATRVQRPYTRLLSDEIGNSYTTGGASASTTLQYRYETVPRSFTLYCNLGASGSAFKDTDTANSLDSFLVRQSVDQEVNGHYLYLFANPSISVTNFLDDELFVGASVSGNISYQRYPKYTATLTNRQSTFPDSESTYQYYTLRQDRTVRQPQHTTNYSVNGELSVGRGHIYIGQYAATTMYLVDELRRNGFIRQEPTESQMQQVTEIVYQQRLKHYVDYRLRRIEQLQAVMNYLKSEQIATIEDPLMPLIVQDVWDYFPYYNRSFGFQLRAGVGLEYSRNSLKAFADDNSFTTFELRHRDSVQALDSSANGSTSHMISDDRFTVSLPYLFARAEYQKPVNLKWQVEIWGDARLYIQASAADRYLRRVAGTMWQTIGADTAWDTLVSGQGYSSEFNYKKFYSASVSTQVTYIYNSRTEAALSASLGYGHLDQELKLNEIASTGPTATNTVRRFVGPSFSNARFSLALSTEYRIAIPTTLYASIGYSTGYSPRNFITGYYKYKPQNFQISASINHYIR
ncbi:hypothetical protein C3F09_04030 [candidate division GN15 bacterium]|uniref:DUF5723 domain-containing protein n=1 Tax=candidate division GN15 bacterium TaxID=2072418 RepID=A0A855X460_9BACT|nr:MAG: hypothetical protein C3F09_04030 [candidate division GN15 bacterium]